MGDLKSTFYGVALKLKWLKNRNVYVLVALFFIFAFFQKLWVIASYDGGTDILCDLDKTLMVLRGLNPYSGSAWAAPYPPFYFIVLAGILLVGTGFNVVGSSIAQLVFTLRCAALIFDLFIGLIIYFTLLKRTGKKVYALLTLGLYLFVPSVSSYLEMWFHGDIFGYFFVALAAFLFVSRHYSLGSLFLGLGVIFKIHPVLTLPLVAIWFYRNRTGFMRNVAILGTTIFLGLILPAVFVPGCYQVLVGYNTSTTPIHTFSLFNLFYNILPVFYQVSISLSTINLMWAVSTLALLIIMSGVVWKGYRELELLDVLTVGIVIWLLPLRTVSIHYLLWFIIPFLMRGKFLENVFIISIQGIAALTASFSWLYFAHETQPSANGALTFFGVAVICAICGVLTLYFILRESTFVKAFRLRDTMQQKLT